MAQILTIAKKVAGALGTKVKVPTLDAELKLPPEVLRIVGAVAAGNIIEAGANSNGWYVKYADGTMVCWDGEKQHNVTYQQWASMDGRYIYATGLIYFPVAFASPPSVCFAGGSNAHTYGFMSTHSVSSASVGGLVLTFVLDLSNCTMNYVAIGRWK